MTPGFQGKKNDYVMNQWCTMFVQFRITRKQYSNGSQNKRVLSTAWQRALLYYIICSMRLGRWQPGSHYIYKAFPSFISHIQQLNRVYFGIQKYIIHIHSLWMKMIKGKSIKAWLNKCYKKGREIIPSEAECERCCSTCQWCLWPSVRENKTIPKDVPKGHLVVYVGEYRKRFVIKITLLKHPLFQALLDHAREVYDFDTTSKLCIPCDENVFQSVVRCATSPRTCFFS